MLNIPITVFADETSGTVGETDASISITDDTAEAEASAAESTVGGTEGNVSESAPPSDPGITTATDTNTTTNNGNGSKTTIESYETSAYANQAVNEFSEENEGIAHAEENVNNVQISAPDGAQSSDGQPLKNIVKAENSQGYSKAEEHNNRYIAYGGHEMTTVSLFDGKIMFDYGKVHTYSSKNEMYYSYAEAKITGLKVYDASTKTYKTVGTGDFSNNTNSPTDYSAELSELNAILSLSDIQITVFLYVFASTSESSANAQAKLLEAILTTGTTNATVSLLENSSNVNETSAKNSGKEITFKIVTQEKKTPVTPATIVEQPVEQSVEQQSIPEKSIEEVSATAATSSGEVFPATGLESTSTQNLNVLIMLFVIAFALMGVGLSFSRSKKYFTE